VRVQGIDLSADMVAQLRAKPGGDFTLVDGTWELRSITFRSVSPGELDLMARLAGMRLRERWSAWTREPFTAESRRHVSVWEKL